MRPATQLKILGPLALVAMAFLWWALLPQAVDGPRQRWFFDLNTGELFPAPMEAEAPIPAPSGDLRGAPPGSAAGVEALVLRIDGTDKPVIAYLASYSRPGTALASTASTGRFIERRLVRRVDGGPWVAENSAAGQVITAGAAGSAGGRPFVIDFPPEP